MAIPANAIARVIAFAIEQPGEVDVNEIIVRPTAQGQLCLSRAVGASAGDQRARGMQSRA
jgi:hypothetical protein